MSSRQQVRPSRPVVAIDAERLPVAEAARDEALQRYFAEWVPHAAGLSDGQWQVELQPPPRRSYYVDPRLGDGLAWWSTLAGKTAIRDILLARKKVRGVQLSLSDAWTALAWSTVLDSASPDASSSITVLHADDHQDLMSPRLMRNGDGTLTDLITARPVDVRRPTTVRAAIESGAIGMGSFLVPFLGVRTAMHVRHLRMPSGREHRPGLYRMVRSEELDTLLAPGQPRPAMELVRGGPRGDRPSSLDVGTYTLQESLDGWVDDLPDGPILLHIDCDYFNNRYDADSEWRSHHRTHDPRPTEVAKHVDEFCAAIAPVTGDIDDVTIALSPGFFPAELWQPTVETLLSVLGGRRRRPHAVDRPAGEVRLERGRGTPGHGGGEGGSFWHVREGVRRAGSVWINVVDHPRLGRHHSLTIELNRASRGRGIGRQAYRLAAEASGHDELWLHMRKSNVASRRAAEHAGFVVVDIPEERQLVMRWRPRGNETRGRR